MRVFKLFWEISLMSKRRIDQLTEEVLRGEHVKDRLPDASCEFLREHQAYYFSNAKRRLGTVAAHVVMVCEQNLTDLRLLSKKQNVSDILLLLK